MSALAFATVGDEVFVKAPWPKETSCTAALLHGDYPSISVDHPTQTVTFQVANGRAIYKFSGLRFDIYHLDLICGEYLPSMEDV